MDKKALIVIVENAAWLTRFRFHIPALITKLKHYPGLHDLQAICCKINPGHHPAAKPPASLRRLLLSAENAQIIYDNAQLIKDEKLKKTLEKIALRGEKQR